MTRGVLRVLETAILLACAMKAMAHDNGDQKFVSTVQEPTNCTDIGDLQTYKGMLVRCGGYRVDGQDLGTPTYGVSFIDCADRCYNNSQCNAFGYRWSDKGCGLRAGGVTSFKTQPGQDSGMKNFVNATCGVVGDQNKYRGMLVRCDGYRVDGNDLEPPTYGVSFLECADRCADNDRCIAFGYRLSDRGCGLRGSGVTGSNPSQDRILVSRLQKGFLNSAFDGVDNSSMCHLHHYGDNNTIGDGHGRMSML